MYTYQEGQQDLFNVIGYVGRWNNPTHLVIDLIIDRGNGEAHEEWAIPVDELKESEVNLEDKNGINMYFEYLGNNQALVDTLLRAKAFEVT